MIIVSQDKRLITESLALSIENIDGEEKKKIMVQEYCGKLYLLGTYATEERAKEVLQEIIKSYVESKKGEESTSIFGFAIIPSNTYYEMPES